MALRSSLSSFSHKDVRDISDLKEIKEAPDFVIISNPTFLHKEAILMAASLNSPLFIEKPVLSNYDGAEDLRSSVKCFSIIFAPKATAATGISIPLV